MRWRQEKPITETKEFHFRLAYDKFARVTASDAKLRDGTRI